MNRDKQIEEMASDLENHTCMSQYQAEIASRMLYAKGYRKAFEVAEEIFAEIYKAISNSVKTGFLKGTWFDYSKFITEVDKLKKKYTEEGK